MNTFFSAPRMRTRALRAALAVAVGVGSLLVVDVHPAAAGLPGVPSGVTITAAPDEPAVIVSWSPAAGAVDTYGIEIYQGTTLIKDAFCGETCRSRVVRHLTPGQVVRAQVFATSGGVQGARVGSGEVAVRNPCAGGTSTTTCIGIDATRIAGPVTGVAQGFLHSNLPTLQQDRVQALRPRSWRVRLMEGDSRSLDAARATGAEVILLISDAVRVRETDLNPIEAYRTRLRSYLQSIVAAGRTPDLWEVTNEPEGLLWTPARQLELWDVAYEEIMTADPGAQIIGMSNGRFVPTDDLKDPTMLSLEAFLDHVVAKGQRLDAIGWHENSIPLVWDFENQPTGIRDHVAWAREMLAARGLQDVELRIDEYGGPADGLVPGWQVGWMTSLEAAGVQGAQRSCFPFAHGLTTTYDGCESPSLDNALNPETQATRANYWVERAYGRMQGERVVTTASASTLSTLAVRDTAGGVTALVGRHASCLPIVNKPCPSSSGHAPLPTDVPVKVSVPAVVGAMRVVVERVSFSTGDVAAPAKVLDSTVTVANGAASFTLPRVADGDALIVTMTPTAVPTASATTSTNLLASVTSALKKLGL